jgi:3-dehydroquinate synthase
MRGIPWVAIPTTLLAQIDAAIGGKTGINLRQGKNLIGTFCHPKEVLIDPKLLKTLPLKQKVNGLAEMIKYGMIGVQGILPAIEKQTDLLFEAKEKPMDGLIARCARFKAKVVSEDEHDRGRRQILNFGHTLGHALEAESGYGKIPHGYAVAAGMLFASRVSNMMGICDEKVTKRLENVLKRAGLYPKPIRADKKALIRAMATDKKRENARQIRFILPEKTGKVVTVNLDTNVLARKDLWRFDCR